MKSAMEALQDKLQKEQNSNKVLRDNYDVLLKQIEKIKWNLRDVSLERKSKHSVTVMDQGSTVTLGAQSIEPASGTLSNTTSLKIRKVKYHMQSMDTGY